MGDGGVGAALSIHRRIDIKPAYKCSFGVIDPFVEIADEIEDALRRAAFRELSGSG
jgi:hypothetical protein